ncbi:MAG: hypothetical protein AAFO06_14265 [Cyanobacteria bacterium J06597_16]
MKVKPLALTDTAIKHTAIKTAIKHIAITPRWLMLSLLCILPVTSCIGFASPALATRSQVVSYSVNKSGVNSYRDSLNKLRSTAQAPILEHRETALTNKSSTTKGQNNTLNNESVVPSSNRNSTHKNSTVKKRILVQQKVENRLEQTKAVVAPKPAEDSTALVQKLPFMRNDPFALIEATRQNSVDQLHAGQFTAQAGDFGTQAFPKSLSVNNALSIQQLKTDVSQLPVRLKSTVAAAKTRLPAIVEGNYYKAGQAKVGQVRTDFQNKLNTAVSYPVNSMRDRIKTLQQTIKEKISTLLQQIGHSASSTAKKLQQP